MQKIDRIEIYPYDSNWPNIFERESVVIKRATPNLYLANFLKPGIPLDG